MIVDLLLDLFVGLCNWVLGLFPSGGPSNPFQDLAMVYNNLAALDYFLPIHELAAAVFGVMFVFPVLMGVSLVTWAVAFLRGASPR